MGAHVFQFKPHDRNCLRQPSSTDKVEKDALYSPLTATPSGALNSLLWNDPAHMLTQLSIRHYAIVDHLEIDFRQGMTVITGETGAGKSIMLGALGLTLGDRADKGVISSGATRADITAYFDASDQPMARSWLQDNELLAEDEPHICLLRRVVSDDGRSKAWVNGFPVTLQVLKTIGEMLIDIHSQHEHQSLLNRSTHLRLLDEFIGDHALTDDVRRISREWKKNRERLETLSQQSEESSAQVQLIRYQIGELEELALEGGEIEALEEEYRTLNSADSSLATAQQLLDLCSENDEFTVQGSLNQALALLQELSAKTGALNPVAELLSTASIQIEEAVAELRHGIDHFEANPLRLEAINQRLSDIQQIARKHRIKPDELTALHASLQRVIVAEPGGLRQIVDARILRERPQRLRDGAAEAGIGPGDPSSDCGGRGDIGIKRVSKAEIAYIHLVQVFEARREAQAPGPDVADIEQEGTRQFPLDIECPTVRVAGFVGSRVHIVDGRSVQ